MANAFEIPEVDGGWELIMADPPWHFTTFSPKGGKKSPQAHYRTMPLDVIKSLPVGDIAAKDAILWLWTTNAFMRDAFRIVDAWGFQERSMLTWAKDRMGTGHWLRGQTEHAILAVRGRPVVMLTNQTTLLHAPMREHSRKPDEFYALVETLCPGSKVEMFAREPRKGWARWGAESEKFAADGE